MHWPKFYPRDRIDLNIDRGVLQRPLCVLYLSTKKSAVSMKTVKTVALSRPLGKTARLARGRSPRLIIRHKLTRTTSRCIMAHTAFLRRRNLRVIIGNVEKIPGKPSRSMMGRK